MIRWLNAVIGKVRRWEAIAAILLALLWVPVFVAYPLLTWSEGTARNISVSVIKEPYRESPTLQYEWRGEVYRSCEISLRRMIVDANGQIHPLVNSPILAAVPRDQLGMQRHSIDVTVGPNLPEGPASYRVFEVPRCTWLQRLWPVSVAYPPVEFTVTR